MTVSSIDASSMGDFTFQKDTVEFRLLSSIEAKGQSALPHVLANDATLLSLAWPLEIYSWSRVVEMVQ